MNKDLKIAKQTINSEIQALKKLSASFNHSSQFSKAVNLISKIRGKCLVVGVGKSYLVGLKISATLSSLGTPSVAFRQMIYSTAASVLFKKIMMYCWCLVFQENLQN